MEHIMNQVVRQRKNFRLIPRRSLVSDGAAPTPHGDVGIVFQAFNLFRT
jgi:hypothetical protein